MLKAMYLSLDHVTLFQQENVDIKLLAMRLGCESSGCPIRVHVTISVPEGNVTLNFIDSRRSGGEKEKDDDDDEEDDGEFQSGTNASHYTRNNFLKLRRKNNNNNNGEFQAGKRCR